MSQDQGILEYLKKLSEKPATTIRIFEKNDYYTVYGDDAGFLSRELFKTTSLLKTIEIGSEKTDCLHLSTSNFEFVIRNLLLERQYRIEIYQNKGTGRTQDWSLGCKASPGNLTQLEDVLFVSEQSYSMDSKGVIAIKISSNGAEQNIGVAYCDTLLRDIKICEFIDNSDLTHLQSVLVQLSPKECLLAPCTDPAISQKSASVIKLSNILLSDCKQGDFNSKDIIQDLNRLLKLEEGCNFQNSMPDESDMKLAISAVAAIIKNLELLSDESNFGQFNLSTLLSKLYAKIDIHSVQGLGLVPVASKGGKKTSLFGLLNECRTAPGERLISQWIKQPLLDLRKIEERLDIVECFVSDTEMRQSLHENYLRRIPDLQLLSRKIQRHKATLQDLYKVYQLILKLPSLHQCIAKHKGPHEVVLKTNFCDDLQERMDDFVNFMEMIVATIDLKAVEEREYIVKAECDDKLTEIKDEMEELKSLMSHEIDRVAQDLCLTAHKTLKLEFCKQIGYHFRVTKKEEKCLRNKSKYLAIDTKASGVRFRDTFLKDKNDRYMALLKSYEEIQKAIVAQIVDVAASYHASMKLLSETLARLDAFVAFACTAVSAPKPYVRPKITERGKGDIILKKARHPYIELQPNVDFIPNDIEIIKDKSSFFFITGPNMGGKSTFIKSVALNVLMAQIGSFVPCDEAEISIVDAILTRVGAGDNPIKGISTFMAEMNEVKSIISTATSDSLLIIDEMGRGTSTYDGFGISWSISEHIANVIKSPCLFATHFHELTELSKEIPTISNMHASALTTERSITFLYRIRPGVCDQSFGIHVAEMANFPKCVTEHAKVKLKDLDEECLPIQDIIKRFADVPNAKVLLSALRYLYPAEFADSLGDSFSTLHNLPDITASDATKVADMLLSMSE